MGALTRAVRNLSRRKMRAFLVVIALGFSLAIMISLPAGILANQQSTQNLTTNYNNAISQVEQELTLITVTNSSSSTSSSPGGGFGGGGFGGGGFGFGGFSGQGNYMDEGVADEIASISGVVAVVPTLVVGEGITTQTFTGYGGRSFTFNESAYTIEGVPLNSSLITGNYVPLPTNITLGRNLQSGDSGVAVLSQNNTGYFDQTVGGTVNINGTNFQVVGVHGESGSSSTFALGQATDVRTLYMNITDAQSVSGLTGEISTLYVYADNSSDVTNVATQISNLYQTSNLVTPSYPLSVTTEESELQMIENTTGTALANDESAISSTQTVAFEEIAVAVVATSLIVLFVMLYTVRERTKEIGTLKAIGFSNWNVMSQFMLEGIVLSFVAGIVGIAIGSIGAPIISGLLLPHISNPFSSLGGRSGAGGYFVTRGGGPSVAGVATAVSAAAPSPELMLIALGAAVVLGALGSLYPAWRASRTRPAEAMRYE
jgi:ABC-type antimicrobial peptide transport system permease subunit